MMESWSYQRSFVSAEPNSACPKLTLRRRPGSTLGRFAGTRLAKRSRCYQPPSHWLTR